MKGTFSFFAFSISATLWITAAALYKRAGDSPTMPLVLGVLALVLAWNALRK